MDKLFSRVLLMQSSQESLIESLVLWQNLFQEGQNIDLELCLTEAKTEGTIFQ